MDSLSFCSVGDLVVDIYKQEGFATLGGTAFCAVLTAKKLGIASSIISQIGNDSFGETYQRIFAQQGIDTSHLSQTDNKTSSIIVTLDKNGTPDFSGWEMGALSTFSLSTGDDDFITGHTIIRTALLKPFEKVFTQVASLRAPNTLKIADFAGGSMYSNERDILTRYINDFDIIAKSITRQEQSDLSYYEHLAKQTGKIILLTAGKYGSIVFKNERRYDYPVQEIITQNTTGSGDVYQSAFAIRYQQTRSVEKAMKDATETVRAFLKDQIRYIVSL